MPNVEVYIVVTGQKKHTPIPNGPFLGMQAANIALYNYAVQTYGSFLHMINAIDEYGFIIQGAGTVSVPTKP